MVIVGVSPDPADNEHMIAWARAYWAALHPYSAGGAYVNMMMEREGRTGCAPPTATTTTAWRRSRRTYDPHNLFRVNQNIKPV